MAKESGSGSDGIRRPLLGGGEKLREIVEVSGGGGEKGHPYTVFEAFESLAPQAEALLENVRTMPEGLRADHVVVEAKLLPNYLAATYFPQALIENAGLYPVGTRIAKGTLKTAKQEREGVDTKTLILAGDLRRVMNFAKRATIAPTDEKDPFWAQLRYFSDLKVPTVDEVLTGKIDELGAGEVITWEAVLNQIGRDELERAELGGAALARWFEYVRSLDGDVDEDYVRPVGGMVFVPVALQKELVEEAARFNLLRALRPMPKIRPRPQPIFRSTPHAPLPPPPTSDTKPETDERVAIFDGGIDASQPYFAPYVNAVDLTSEPPDVGGLNHGSVVTTALLYGHIDHGQTTLPPAKCYADHFRVFPPPSGVASTNGVDAGSYWILDQIVATVRTGDYRLVNLSLGPNEAVVSGGVPHRWTVELDELAIEKGVTFFVAAGNNGGLDDSLELNRIQVPGDMVNGITVGATASRGGKPVRAEYSAIGPGRFGQRVQPVGVTFGGSDPEPFRGIDHAGSSIEMTGTSYACPSALRGAVHLTSMLGDRASTDAVRAFSAHYARRLNRGHKFEELGYGVLREDYDDVLVCEPNEVSIVYQDRLNRGELIAMRVPFPPSRHIASDEKLDIDWTIAYVTPVNPADAADYTLRGVEDVFRPNEWMRSVSKDGRVHNAIDVRKHAQEAARLTESGFTVSSTPKAHDGTRRKSGFEVNRRTHGKWETIIRGAVRVTASDLYSPRLDLKYITRAGGILTKTEPPLEFTMIVTLTARKGVTLYDLVRQKYTVLTPLVAKIPVTLKAS
jgi:Subtilase family